ncbi:MAG TPA: hypothetical protein VG013_01460 [Gemmataceae bacterium]|nr:hypothetical protein [Gemmataceae bacterium]
MMVRRPVLLSCLCACGTAVALVLSSSPARGQGGVLPEDGQSKLEEKYDRDARASIKDLVTGKVGLDKGNESLADLEAQWLTYRLTWSDVQTKEKMIDALMKDLDSDLVSAAKNRPATDDFLKVFLKKLVECSRRVLNPQQPAIARVNAAQVLARVAQSGDEGIADAVADALTEVLKDQSQNDGVKYWACRGLQQVFAPGIIDRELRMPPRLLKNKDSQARCTLALLEFIDRKLPVSATTPLDEAEGLRVVRREAIRALALTQYPAVIGDKNALQGRTAQTLERVIRHDGFLLEPRWDEELEAAIGLGWLKVGLFPDYQPDTGAQAIGAALVNFAKKYEAEKFDRSATDDKSKFVDRGWKYYAARLTESLEGMKADVAKNVKDKGTVDYVNQIVQKSTDMLKLIDTRGDTKPGDLDNWLRSNPPKSDTVYKGVADSKVKPPEPAEK